MTINETIKTAKETIRNLFANNETEKAIEKAKETKEFLELHNELAEAFSLIFWVRNVAWENKKVVEWI